MICHIPFQVAGDAEAALKEHTGDRERTARDCTGTERKYRRSTGC